MSAKGSTMKMSLENIEPENFSIKVINLQR